MTPRRGLQARLAQGPVTGYIGFDPTADSLHVGSLLPVMGLAWLQRFGGRPIALVGGGTGMVGDPSGKRDERPILSVEVIDRNSAALKAQLAHFLDFEGPAAARVMNNADWLRGLGLMEFLRDTGKHFTVNYMLQKDSVQSRMETGISFTEFSYMLVQAYDFWHLFRTARCELQMGGSDQWGNITAGIELIGRREQGSAHGLVMPLLTTSAGAKFGKSEEGNVWLDPARTSPYKFFQFWLNTDDRDVERLLNFFTFLSSEEIAAAMAEQAGDPSRRSAQRLLAAGHHGAGARRGHRGARRGGERRPLRRHRPPDRTRRCIRGAERRNAHHGASRRHARYRPPTGGRAGDQRTGLVQERRPAGDPGEGLCRQWREDR